MIKIIHINSFYLVGKAADILYYLSSISDKNITVHDYIRQEAVNYRHSLN